jgi:hypothetical protein
LRSGNHVAAFQQRRNGLGLDGRWLAHCKPNGTTGLERLRNFTWNGGAQAGPAKSPGAVSRQYGAFSPENHAVVLTKNT